MAHEIFISAERNSNISRLTGPTSFLGPLRKSLVTGLREGRKIPSAKGSLELVESLQHVGKICHMASVRLHSLLNLRTRTMYTFNQ